MSHIKAGLQLSRLRAIVGAIGPDRALTCAEIAEAIEVEEHSVRKSLQAYMRLGCIKRGPLRVRGQRLGKCFLETWMVGDKPVPEVTPAPARRQAQPPSKRSPSGTIETQAVLFVTAPQHDSGIVAQALARRLPIEVAVQRWRCAA